MKFQDALLQYLDHGASDAMAVQNPDGSFGALRMINSQYPMYTLGYLARRAPQSRHYGSDKAIAAALRAMAKLSASIDEEGLFEFIGQNGISWGRAHHDWTLFCWQEALHLLKGDLPADLWRRYHDQIANAVKRYAANTQSFEAEQFADDVHNLKVWKGLLFYRAGGYMDEASWRELGERILQAAMRFQHPDGWWSEGGPVVGYSLVTAMAVSLYAEWSGNADALRTMERAAEYHAALCYPNGGGIECIDGRMRYHIHPTPYIPPSFGRFPAGRRFFDAVTRSLHEIGPLKEAQIQGVSFLSFTLEHLSKDADAAPTPPCPPQTILPAISTGVLRRDGWTCALAGVENRYPLKGGFRLERQNILSLWHDRTGLILGGGHSCWQPEFSLFNVIDRHGAMTYLHRDPKLTSTDDSLALEMSCGGARVQVEVRLLDARRATVRFTALDFTKEAHAERYIRANLVMVARFGGEIRCGGFTGPLDEKSILWTEEDFPDGIEHNGWRLMLPKERSESVSVRWPVRPYNSYRRDRKSEITQAALIASVQLFPEQQSMAEYEIDILG